MDDFRLTYLGTSTPVCDIEIGEGGYAAYVTAAPLDLSSAPEGLTAYIITGLTTSRNPVLSEITGAVAQGQPVLFSGTSAGIYSVPVSFGPFDGDVASNKLRAPNRAVQTTSSATIYVLDTRDTYGTGFYPLASNESVAENQPYLEVSGRRVAFMSLPDIPTGIRTVHGRKTEENGPVYNLAGQRLKSPQKGINILNGKKIFVE